MEPTPAPGPESPREAWQAAVPNPPSHPEADEVPAFGEAVALPSIPSSRREREARKAQALRESRRRKLERLRA